MAAVRCLAVLLGMTLSYLSSVTASVADEEAALAPAKLVTGQSLQRALKTRVRWSTTETTLGSQLQTLQQRSGICIVLDRRIDPNRSISLTTDMVATRDIIESMVRQFPDLDSCITDQFVYVGPSGAAQRLPILAELANAACADQRKTLGAAAVRKLGSRHDVTWPRLAEPVTVLQELATTAGVQITNPELIPHDLWNEGNVPGLNFADAATLLLNQFDLSIVADAAQPGTFRVAPIAQAASFERRYAVGNTLKAAAMAAWESHADRIEIRWAGSTATVTAALAEHALLNSALEQLKWQAESGKKATTASLHNIRFDLVAQQGATVGSVVDSFRKNDISIDIVDEDSPAVVAVLEQQVEFTARGLPAREFFGQLFGPFFSSVTVLDDRVILKITP